MPKITMDGRELEAKDGSTIIETASAHGIEIPHYCWHPRLSVAANCRMCLVEVEKAPKLLPACEVKVREGMVVKTHSEPVLEARKAVMEFMLINHPIDCPICDQAGECKLQDYYMKHDQTGTRFSEVKVEKSKAVTLGSTVVLDQERCINCTRCVRFMEEIAGNPLLGQFDRGDRAVIGVFPGQPLEDPYSANVVDICPVGALTYRDFRFKTRAWFLKSADSVCTGCARGCSVRLDFSDNEIKRIKPRENDFVNQSWMCDDGRLTYKRIHDKETQITKPHIKRDGSLVAVGWAEARQELAQKLGGYLGEGDGALGMALSPQITTEGGAAFVELALQLLQVDTFAITGLSEWESDDILKVADRNPNRAGLELVLESYSIYDEGSAGLRQAIEDKVVRTLLMVGSEYPEDKEAWTQSLAKLEGLVVFATNWDDTAKAADIVIPIASHAEQDGTFVNFEARLQRIHRALAPIGGRKTLIDAAAFTAAALGDAGTWTVRSWTDAFDHLRKRTNLLAGIDPKKLPAIGVTLESDKSDSSSKEKSSQAEARA